MVIWKNERKSGEPLCEVLRGACVVCAKIMEKFTQLMNAGILATVEVTASEYPRETLVPCSSVRKMYEGIKLIS